MERTMIFSSAMFGVIRHRELTPAIENTQRNILGDGTMVCTDLEGTIRQVNYASGAKVTRQVKYCMVQSTGDLSYWYGDDKGVWYRLD